MGRQARQQQRIVHGTISRQRPPVRPAQRKRAPRPLRDTTFTPAWLILDFPTAVLLAVFVGTGWLGYAQTSGTPAQPRPAVVVPAEHPAPRCPERTRASHDCRGAAAVHS
ncbi:hypothetical protein [Nocardia crassostreae]|uniref:hypothetical protein n=1 Tax=Nocardia crassostreae TaxID=53428 RepID=UPI00082E88E4|nr:hypothetical protein [Nocardia crassostreae]